MKKVSPPDWSVYYNPANHRFMARALFIETQQNSHRSFSVPPFYTVKPFEKEGLVSAYQVYMDSVDEYDAALKLCPTYTEWERLIKSKWFMEGDKSIGHEGLKTWREHMKKRDASLAKAQLVDKTKEGNVTAAKALLAETKPKAGAGRRTKKQEPEKTKLALVKEFKNKREARKG